MVLSALHLGFLILVQWPYCVGYLMRTSVGRPFCCSGECSWLRKSNISIYRHVTKWQHWGIFKHWGSKLPLPPMLCKSDCHRRSFYRGSDASTRPSQWLGIIGGLCQVLEAHKISHLQDSRDLAVCTCMYSINSSCAVCKHTCMHILWNEGCSVLFLWKTWMQRGLLMSC